MKKQKSNRDNYPQNLHDTPADQGPNYEAELLTALREKVDSTPFNEFLGLKVISLSNADFCMGIESRPELIGNKLKGILHGGVISAILDITGSVIAVTGVMKKTKGRSIEEVIKHSTKIGTIDLRVDYLKPGAGKYFRATGSLLRIGSAVCVTRMELRNDQEQLIAVGTGTYKVG